MSHSALLLCLVLSLLFLQACASYGDQTSVFRQYLQKCLDDTCNTDSSFYKMQPFHLRVLGWNCMSECKYISMWRVVASFQESGFRVPQFYGKWPFVRILGVQEPASMIFSLLNGAGHIYMIFQLRKQVSSFAPMYNAWHFYCILSVHAWFWSIVFHTRDLPFTERMDYFSAFSLNLSGILMFCLRTLALKDDGLDFRIGGACVCILCIIFYRHVSYLSGVHFDYGYNMRVNVTVGLLSTAMWVSWSLWHIRRRPYLWKAIVSILAANVLLLLELGDFPPVFWMFDAHSLWHGGTFPLVFLWYSYCIDDCKLMHNARNVAKKQKSLGSPI